MSVRKPAVAGSFYSADKKGLQIQIGDFLKKAACSKSKKIFGVIAPHAGYVYSGQAAAYSYRAINKSTADTFIILGTNHTGYAESDFALSSEDFETPFGIARNDREFLELLIKNGKNLVGNTSNDEIAHQQEHSIEVQLPFLQFILHDKFKIVPIICQIQQYENYVEFAKLLVETAKKVKRKICIIASSDFAHYGSAYGFVPFTSNIKQNLYNLDSKAIDLILKFKTAEFLDYASKTTICGAGAIAALIESCKLLGSKKAELLKYYTSGDVTGDYCNAVGYASIVFG